MYTPTVNIMHDLDQDLYYIQPTYPEGQVSIVVTIKGLEDLKQEIERIETELSG